MDLQGLKNILKEVQSMKTKTELKSIGEKLDIKIKGNTKKDMRINLKNEIKKKLSNLIKNSEDFTSYGEYEDVLIYKHKDGKYYTEEYDEVDIEVDEKEESIVEINDNPVEEKVTEVKTEEVEMDRIEVKMIDVDKPTMEEIMTEIKEDHQILFKVKEDPNLFEESLKYINHLKTNINNIQSQHIELTNKHNKLIKDYDDLSKKLKNAEEKLQKILNVVNL
jgi:hypothetical protein